MLLTTLPWSLILPLDKKKDYDGPLYAPWWKVKKGKEKFQEWLKEQEEKNRRKRERLRLILIITFFFGCEKRMTRDPPFSISFFVHFNPSK